MKRWTLLALLLLNLGLAAWHLGWLSRWGWGPQEERDPALTQPALRPEMVAPFTPSAPASEASAEAPAAQAEASEASAPTPPAVPPGAHR